MPRTMECVGKGVLIRMSRLPRDRSSVRLVGVVTLSSRSPDQTASILNPTRSLPATIPCRMASATPTAMAIDVAAT